MVNVPRAITHCPNCGSSVTPYAAGCAICGADIEAARRARESSRTAAIRHPSVPHLRLGGGWFAIAVAVLLAVASPFLGLLLALWLGWQANRDGNTTMRTVMLAIAVLAAIPLVTGVYPWGRFILGL
jgi:hypothetical protein